MPGAREGSNAPVREDPLPQQGALNVKRILLSSAIAAAMFATCLAWACLTGGQASAQQPMAPSAAPAVQGPGGIAVVDVNYIFKHHLRMKAQLAELQAEATKVQQDFEQELKALQDQARLLNGMKPGTPEYQQLDEKMVTLKANIQGKIALRRKEFVQKEAHLYFNAYREISDEVKYFAEQRGILLVMNFNGDNIRDDNPDDVARGISNKMVYVNKGLDITGIIVRRFDGTNNAVPTASERGNVAPMGLYAPPR